MRRSGTCPRPPETRRTSFAKPASAAGASAFNSADIASYTGVAISALIYLASSVRGLRGVLCVFLGVVFGTRLHAGAEYRSGTAVCGIITGSGTQAAATQPLPRRHASVCGWRCAEGGLHACVRCLCAVCCV